MDFIRSKTHRGRPCLCYNFSGKPTSGTFKCRDYCASFDWVCMLAYIEAADDSAVRPFSCIPIKVLCLSEICNALHAMYRTSPQFLEFVLASGKTSELLVYAIQNDYNKGQPDLDVLAYTPDTLLRPFHVFLETVTSDPTKSLYLDSHTSTLPMIRQALQSLVNFSYFVKHHPAYAPFVNKQLTEHAFDLNFHQRLYLCLRELRTLHDSLPSGSTDFVLHHFAMAEHEIILDLSPDNIQSFHSLVIDMDSAVQANIDSAEPPYAPDVVLALKWARTLNVVKDLLPTSPLAFKVMQNLLDNVSFLPYFGFRYNLENLINAAAVLHPHNTDIHQWVRDALSTDAKIFSACLTFAKAAVPTCSFSNLERMFEEDMYNYNTINNSARGMFADIHHHSLCWLVFEIIDLSIDADFTDSGTATFVVVKHENENHTKTIMGRNQSMCSCQPAGKQLIVAKKERIDLKPFTPLLTIFIEDVASGFGFTLGLTPMQIGTWINMIRFTVEDPVKEVDDPVEGVEETVKKVKYSVQKVAYDIFKHWQKYISQKAARPDLFVELASVLSDILEDPTGPFEFLRLYRLSFDESLRDKIDYVLSANARRSRWSPIRVAWASVVVMGVTARQINLPIFKVARVENKELGFTGSDRRGSHDREEFATEPASTEGDIATTGLGAGEGSGAGEGEGSELEVEPGAGAGAGSGAGMDTVNSSRQRGAAYHRE